MTMLSPKARAFSVDHLLGKCEDEKDLTSCDDKKLTEANEVLCPLLGGDRSCSHRNLIEARDDTGNRVAVELCQGDLWQAFHRLGTEMIITKTGRRMFPAIRIRVSGLKKSSRYVLSMAFVPVDKNKYRYVYHSSKWMVSGIGEGIKQDRKYRHPDSPFSGEYISSQVVSFEKIKLTNNENPPEGQVTLLSMQKFQPRICVEEVTDKGEKHGNPLHFSFPQTAFIAVTAYQNQEITRLKIARNPFAKGFREAGKCRSSLEAMMASLGAYMEPVSPTGYHRKRTSDEMIETEGEDMTQSAKRVMPYWSQLPSTPSMLPDPRFYSPYIPISNTGVPLVSNPYYYGDILYTRNSPKSQTTPTQYSDIVKDLRVTQAPHSSSVSSSYTTCVKKDKDIHPAFRISLDSSQQKYQDTKYLQGYSNGVMYNPLASIMYFPTPVTWSTSDNRSTEANKSPESTRTISEIDSIHKYSQDKTSPVT